MSRPLDVRLTEYRDNLWSLADQLDELSKRVRPIDGDGQASLADAARQYRLIGNDLAVLLTGDELKGFIITGQAP